MDAKRKRRGFDPIAESEVGTILAVGRAKKREVIGTAVLMKEKKIQDQDLVKETKLEEEKEAVEKRDKKNLNLHLPLIKITEEKDTRGKGDPHPNALCLQSLPYHQLDPKARKLFLLGALLCRRV